jgi:glycosyltransferase involved in cell wall biosynthesis
VAGDAARLVDPWDTDSIAEGLADVLLDEDLRRHLSHVGPLRAAEFTWKKCAQETAGALNRAIQRAA